MEEKTGKAAKLIWLTLASVFSISLILLVSAVVFSIAAVFQASEKLENISEITIPEPEKEKSSYIYSLNSLTGEYDIIYKATPYTGNVCIETDIDTLPDYVKNAFISIEDERFYEHEGIDITATSLAVAKEVLRTAGFINSGEVRGGSTITQQLVKNLTSDDEVSVDRKLREISRAVSLETHYTKEEILEKYLSVIYFGQTEDGCNMYGIEAAAAGYFGKRAAELTPAEAACLAALIQNPSVRNPLENPERNRERQLYCLRKMFEHGYLSADTYEYSKKEKMNFVHPGDEPETKLSDYGNDFENPEVTSWAIDTALQEFCDFICDYKDISREEGMQEFRNGGYELYLTIDENVQAELERNMADYTFFPEDYAYYTDENGEEHAEQVQAAAVVLDYKGEIKGICGGIGPKTTSFCWNNATDARRQPGSTIKPLTTYVYGIENDLITWSDIFTDSPLPAGTAGESEWPVNYNGKYSGSKYPVWQLLAESFNTVPAQLCNMFGPENVFNFTHDKMKLDLNPETDITLAALSIGATGSGPSLLNLANSYMPFGNGGYYYKAHILKRIKDSTSSRVYVENDTRKGERVISEETAFIMRKLLRKVILQGTGKPANLQNRELSGKTGTSENYRDVLFAGLTEDYVSAVWTGYENASSSALRNVSSSEIWKNVFGNYADSVKTNASFPECETVEFLSYCAESGKIAGKKCPVGGKGFYKTGKTEKCDINHNLVKDSTH